MGERSAQHLFGLQTRRISLVSQILFAFYHRYYLPCVIDAVAGALAESKHTLQTWTLISAIDDYWSISSAIATGCSLISKTFVCVCRVK